MSQPYTTHYGISMKNSELKDWAKKIVEQIVKSCTADGVTPVLLYTGMSGITAATALALSFQQDFRFVQEYVRKAKEKTHGRKVETFDIGGYDQKVDKLRYFIVDDFIASGATVNSMLNLYQIYFLREITKDSVYLALSSNEHISKLDQAHLLKGIIRNNAKVRKIKKDRAEALKAIFSDGFKIA